MNKLDEIKKDLAKLDADTSNWDKAVKWSNLYRKVRNERNRYKRALEHIAKPGRCPNPQQCAFEALNPLPEDE